MRTINHVLLFFLMLILGSCSNKGELVPEFELTTIEGVEINQKDLEGKITVINVWATWCGNCLNEMDELNQLADKYAQDKDVVFLAITDESTERVEAFLDRRPFHFTHISNGIILTDELQTRLVKTFPQHIVLDRNMNIRFEQSGEIQNTVNVLSNQIEQLR